MMALRELFHVFSVGLESSLHRPRHLVLIAAGLLIASSALLLALTIPAGLSRIAARTGRADVAVVLASARRDESEGSVAPELVGRIGTLPGVAHDMNGSPLVSAQFVAHAKLPRRDGMPSTILIRGVTPDIWLVVGNSAQITTGKPIVAGINELLSGSNAALEYVYARSGASITLNRSIWRVSGEFDSGGSLWDSEFWADLDALQAAYNSPGRISTLWVRLATPGDFDRFTQGMRSDPRLRGLTVMTQRDFYASRVALLMLFVNLVAWIITIVLGLQAALAGYNAISLSLRARRRELALLRAVGFGRMVLFASLLFEVLLIAAACSCVVVALGLTLLNGYGIDSSTADASIHFTAAVTPGVALSILVYTVTLASAAALFPALTTLRAPLILTLGGE